jgi:chromosome segregation ATPase
MDERYAASLETQLRDAHSANADLRERLGDVEARERAADAKLNEATVLNRQLEKSHAKQKAAEDNAAAAQRKQAEAEREALRARGQIEELEARVERLQVQADVLNELNTRIDSARHVHDLIGKD